MFVKEESSGDLIRVDDVKELINPTAQRVYGRRQAGQEEQDLAEYEKERLIFPSGESLPQCWKDKSYQLR